MEQLGAFLTFFGFMAGAIAVPMLVVYLVPVVAKALKRWLEPPATSPDEVAALRAEVEELRALASRVSEQEERLDFAERVLARPREADIARPEA